MGTWATGLFSNDLTSDVRDTYIQFLKQQLNNEEAYQQTYEEYEELMGTEEEALFWYALADTQWNVGRLTPKVKNCALQFIQKSAGSSLWEENHINIDKWHATLKKLEEKINSPMPVEKEYSKPVEFERNPWNTGDVYAYQFHTKKAIQNGLYGKYILMQKVGNSEYYKDLTFSVIQIFNRVFDSIPDINLVKDLDVLPLVYSPIDGCFYTVEDYIPSFEWYLKATTLYEKKNDYPKNFLKFVGTVDLPEKNHIANKQTDFYWDKHRIDDWLIDYYLSWQSFKTGDNET